MNLKRLARAISVAGLLFAPGAAGAQSALPAPAPTGALPATLPVFPLPDTVLFPDVSLPLHIFEPRYRAMVADALKGDRIIGMVLLRPGFEADYEGRPPIYPIGTAGTIADVEELPDGRYNLVLRGLMKFRVTGEDQSRAYRLARVEAIPEPLTDRDRAALRGQRQRLEAILATSPSSGTKIPPEIPDEEIVNTLSQYLGFDAIERQALLELQSVVSRAQALIDLLELKVVLPR